MQFKILLEARPWPTAYKVFCDDITSGTGRIFPCCISGLVVVNLHNDWRNLLTQFDDLEKCPILCHYQSKMSLFIVLWLMGVKPKEPQTAIYQTLLLLVVLGVKTFTEKPNKMPQCRKWLVIKQATFMHWIDICFFVGTYRV